jgi:hypothetical protein
METIKDLRPHFTSALRIDGLRVSYCGQPIERIDKVEGQANAHIYTIHAKGFCLGSIALTEENYNYINKILTNKKLKDMSKINLIQYSAKCIVIHGETKPHKEVLKMMGGKWNGRLKHASGETFGGWIFPTKSRDELNGWMTALPENINEQYIPSPEEMQYESEAHQNFLHHNL